MCAAELSLFTLNIEGHKHLDRILPFLARHPHDVICLQEVFLSDLPMFEKATGTTAFFAPHTNFTQPNRYDIDPLGPWGIAMLTRLPVKEQRAEYYFRQTAEGIPDFIDGEPNSTNRAVIISEIEKDAQIYTVATTHFTWTPDGQINDEQKRDRPKLFEILEREPELVLCGDFNSPRGRENYAAIAAKYHDCLPAEVDTTLDPELFRIPNYKLVVDSIFCTDGYAVKNVEILTGLSDHCGVRGEMEKKGA